MSDTLKLSEKIILNENIQVDEAEKLSINDHAPVDASIKMESVINITFNIKNNAELVTSFPEFIEKSSSEFVNAELSENHQLSEVTKGHIKEALAFIAYYQLNYINNKQSIKPNAVYRIAALENTSLFEIIVNIYVGIATNQAEAMLIVHPKRIYLKKLFNKIFQGTDHETNEIKTTNKYSTQIIFDNADVTAALYELGNAFQDNTAPWRIRTCWIQQTIKTKFLEEIQSKLKSSQIDFSKCQHLVDEAVEQSRNLGATIIQTSNKTSTFIIGVPRKHIDCDRVVFVNFFRTAKEVLTLINADPDVQCASIWTENISMAYEMADKLMALNVWINSNGILEPSIPFTFDNRIYGSILGLKLDSKDKDEFSESFSMAKITNGKHCFQSISVSSKPCNKHKMICVPFGTIFSN